MSRPKSQLLRTFASSSASSSSRRPIRIMEVSPRDGLQNEKAVLPAALKVELIERLVGVGCRHIEAGSFVSPKWVPQMATTTEVVTSPTLAALRSKHPSPDLTFPCLVPNLRGFSTLSSILSSSSSSSSVVDEIALFAASTESFSKANLNSSIAESLEAMAKVAEEGLKKGLRVRGYVSTAVGCPYEGNVDPEAPARVAKALLEMGCYEISIADTVGVALPPSIRRVLETVCRHGVPMERLAIHCHDTFGGALANVLAAVEMGVRTVDASVGGIGGCPYSPGATGNVATEGVVYALASTGHSTSLVPSNDFSNPLANDPTGLESLEPLAEIGQWINDRLGRENSSRVGKAVLARKAKRETVKAKL